LESYDMRASTEGWLLGGVGMLIFSASMPATRAAVADFPPLFLTVVRAAIPGLLALGVVSAAWRRRPRREDIGPLALVAAGVVVGFPAFSAFALTRIDASHSMVWIGLLPLSTALFGALRAGERMRPAFWAFSMLGAGCVIAFAVSRGGSGDLIGDAAMLAAVVSAGLGYTEGAKLSRRLGGFTVISWALVACLPLTIPLSVALAPDHWPAAGAASWSGLAYVALFSMWLGFAFWYRGLALGGIAAVGQLQLLQPFLGLMISAAWLGEIISAAEVTSALAVLVCVGGARRASLAVRA
jgi:drug/metabolite transporter (DMT)-like permease